MPDCALCVQMYVRYSVSYNSLCYSDNTHTVSKVAALLHTDVTDMLEYNCFLPPQLGGLCLICHAGMSTEKA